MAIAYCEEHGLVDLDYHVDLMIEDNTKCKVESEEE